MSRDDQKGCEESLSYWLYVKWRSFVSVPYNLLKFSLVNVYYGTRSSWNQSCVHVRNFLPTGKTRALKTLTESIPGDFRAYLKFEQFK